MAKREDLLGLRGKVCLVTGGTQGIGLSVAERFAQAGGSIIVSSRHLAKGEKVAAKIAKRHRVPALALAADVADAKDVRRMFSEIREWGQGPVHALACVAGYPVDPALWETPLHKMTPQQLTDGFRSVYETDLQGSRFCAYHALKQMVPERAGSLVFVSSTPALAGYKGPAYTEAKAGLLGLMRDLSRSYGPYGIRSNAIAPGNIRTKWLDQISAKDRRALEKENPLRRFGETREVADTILFLSSRLAAFVTGQVLVVDGGTVSH